MIQNDLSEVAALVEKVISRRRSVRHFSERKISCEDLRRLVRAGINAPSGSNWQNQRFLVVEEEDEIKRIGAARFVWPYRSADQKKIRSIHDGGILGKGAALILVFSDALDNDRRGNGEYHIWEGLETQNCAASIENILIMATAMGIGTCWISASDKMNFTRMFSKKSWRSLLANYEIPEFYKLQGIVLCGYPTSTDEEVFPRGEKMHGATVWQTTKRKPIEEYLINRRTDYSGNPSHEAPAHQRLLIFILSKVIRWCQRLAALCDRKIHHIEVKKHLSKVVTERTESSK